MQDKIFILPSRKPSRTEQNNLPAQLTSLIGREKEVAEICALLRWPQVRILTLTGPGGVGKTRLALQIGSDLHGDFADGVFFVSLAPISDPNLVIPTIIQAFALRETGDQPPLEYLKTYLRDKHLLLLLDNFEQAVEAAPLLIALLQACPHLKMVVTSRAILHVSGEHEFAVLPLALPDLEHLPECDALAQYAAVALFLQRARAIKSDFQLTQANARIIAEICTHLDGLPLGIELAAIRIKLLPPEALLSRLKYRFKVLTGGALDLPTRQQTLRNTIQWSYDLLNAEEKQLFRCLSVFVGGCTLEVVGAMYKAIGNRAINVLDGVTSLLDKSLLQRSEHEGDEIRLTMLESIREYGLECLAASGEAQITWHTYAQYFLSLTQEAESNLNSADQERWLDRLEHEHDNLRAALSWLLESKEIELTLRLSGALWRFWQMRGHFSEGRNFLEQALAESEKVNPSVRAKAFFAAACLAYFQNDSSRREVLAQQSLALYRQLEDKQGIAGSLRLFGELAVDKGDYRVAYSFAEEALQLFRALDEKGGIASSLGTLATVSFVRGEYTSARSMLKEVLAMSRGAGDKRGTANVLWLLAVVAYLQSDFATARQLLEESQVYGRELNYKRGIANTLAILAYVELSQGDLMRAHLLFEESLALHKELGDRQGIAWGLTGLSWVAFDQGDYVLAHTKFEEGLTILQELGNKWWMALCLEGLAGVVSAEGKPVWAARLLAVAETLREFIDAPVPPVHRARYEYIGTTVRTQLSEEALIQAWAEGRSMSLEQALAAQEPVIVHEHIPSFPQPTIPTKTASSSPVGLTARELEVLRLVALGLTDAQVAKQLVISRRTVNWYVTSIYSKIGVTSRSAATRYAMEHQLV